MKTFIAAVVVLGLCAAQPAFAQAQQAAPEKPIDNGPTQPHANDAYQGGGVVLQGAPGAPAPKPEATPPGQAPADSVPPKGAPGDKPASQ